MNQENKVIIICDNHHNGLNIARSFGSQNIFPYGIIICKDIEECYINKSKYWKKTLIIDSYNQLIGTLVDNFADSELKPVVITCSDTAGEIIDLNYDKLKDFFILPSIGGKQGEIFRLMDKEYQVEFAQKYNIPTAKTWVLKPATYQNTVKNIIFPCIVKPVSSYEGIKADIKKCNNKDELNQYLKVIFNEKNYTRILVQEFLEFDYEIEFVGSYSARTNSYLISKTHRGWPIVGGTNSFFSIVDDKNINLMVERILAVFKEIKFNGLFDIEMFNINGDIYLNEINWRNTGNSFFSLGTDVHYAVVWYYAMIHKENTSLKRYCIDVNQFAMNEATDLRHCVFGKYSFLKWNADRAKTNSFALWYSKDLKPTFIRYVQLLKKLVKI